MQALIEAATDALNELGSGNRSAPTRKALGDALVAVRDNVLQTALPQEFIEALQEIGNNHGDPNMPVESFAEVIGVVNTLLNARGGWMDRSVKAEQQLHQIKHDLAAAARVDQLKRDLIDPDHGHFASEFCPAEVRP